MSPAPIVRQTPTIAPIVRANPTTFKKRGSLVDTVTLSIFQFQFEPRVKDKVQTNFAKQTIVGQRLQNRHYVGGGESSVTLDIHLLGASSTLTGINNFKDLVNPQADTGAPHPVYLDIGEMYLGKRWVMTDVSTDVEVFLADDSFNPREAKMKITLEEVPADSR